MIKLITVRDTYFATWLILQGAIFEDVWFKKIEYKKIPKKGFGEEWIIILSGVSQKAIDDWKNHEASANIREFESARIKLKKKIYKARKQL